MKSRPYFTPESINMATSLVLLMIITLSMTTYSVHSEDVEDLSLNVHEAQVLCNSFVRDIEGTINDQSKTRAESRTTFLQNWFSEKVTVCILNDCVHDSDGVLRAMEYMDGLFTLRISESVRHSNSQSLYGEFTSFIKFADGLLVGRFTCNLFFSMRGKVQALTCISLSVGDELEAEFYQKLSEAKDPPKVDL